MLSYVNPFRHRLTLRMNDDDNTFRIRDFWNAQWILVGNEVFATNKTMIKGMHAGQRIDLWSAPGQAQRILLANTLTNQVIGGIEVTFGGGIVVKHYPDLTIGRELPLEHREKCVAVLGVPGFGSMNIKDIQGNKDDDIIRYKLGNTRIFIPDRYKAATHQVDYDVGYQNIPAPEMRFAHRPMQWNLRPIELGRAFGGHSSQAPSGSNEGEQAEGGNQACGSGQAEDGDQACGGEQAEGGENGANEPAHELAKIEPTENEATGEDKDKDQASGDGSEKEDKKN